MRKKFLLKRQSELKERQKELLRRSEESEDVKEVRDINSQLTTLAEDLRAIAEELELLAEKENGDGAGDGNGDEGRSGVPVPGEIRNAQIVGAFGQNVGGVAQRNTSVLASMEYREAFAIYVTTGDATAINKFENRADETLISSDVGKIIPTTIMNEFIKNLKSYGQLYNLVRKLNVRGGVEFPIEDLVPTVTWITETTRSDDQKGLEINTSISFGYHIAEARISQSLLSSIVTLDVLESEIAQLLAEAFIKEFDRIIVSGTGNGQPTGILNDTRVIEKNKITMSEEDVADWTSWRKKLFASIPLAYRGEGVLVMSAGTWESEIMTMCDDNNRPLYLETYNPETGLNECRFNGRQVILVEPDILGDFASVEDGEAFAIYFKPTNYAINSNLQIGFKRYYDDDKNKWINKGLCIVDGKLLDVNGVFILKKGTTEVAG